MSLKIHKITNRFGFVTAADGVSLDISTGGYCKCIKQAESRSLHKSQ